MTTSLALPVKEDGSLELEYPRFRLRDIRDERGITQVELARLIGVSCGYLSQLESGYRRVNSDILFNIVHALDVSMCELFEPVGRTISDLLFTFRGLPEDRQQVVLNFVQQQSEEHRSESSSALELA